MNRKHLGILILVAGAFIVLAFLGRQRADTDSIAGNLAGTLFLPELADQLDNVDQVLLDGPGRQRLVSLEREADGWTVTELGGYPADRSRVNALLIALGDARVVEEKTANPDFYSRLGVEDVDADDAAGLELALVAADGARYATVLGDSYTGDRRYARRAGEDLSVLIDRDPEIPRNPKDWAVAEIIDIASGRVQSVTISHADGERVAMQKESREDTNFVVDDIPDGRELQYAGIANATGNLLQGLRLDDVEPRPADSGEAAAVIEFRTFDGLVVTVTVEEAGEDAEPWLSFDAAFNAEQAAAFAVESADEASADADAETAEAPDVAAEADEINARLAAWRYRIPSYQYTQLTRRMDDLLQPEADD